MVNSIAIRMTSKRQATFPESLCAELGIKPGDRLFLDRRKFEGHTAWILKVPDKDEMKWFGSLRKYAKGKKHDIESVRKSIGKSRAVER